ATRPSVTAKRSGLPPTRRESLSALPLSLLGIALGRTTPGSGTNSSEHLSTLAITTPHGASAAPDMPNLTDGPTLIVITRIALALALIMIMTHRALHPRAPPSLRQALADIIALTRAALATLRHLAARAATWAANRIVAKLPRLATLAPLLTLSLTQVAALA